jgi:putative glutathione S-transferase
MKYCAISNGDETKPQFEEEQSESGEFERQEDAFREWVSADGSTPYSAVAGRYHLYVSLACPWASRTVIVRHLKGLDDAISMTVVDPIRDERGWAFRDGPGYSTDPVNGFAFLSEAYTATDVIQGRVTVPVRGTGIAPDRQQLEDDICRMFNNAFGPLAKESRSFPKEIGSNMRTSRCSFTA